MAVMQEEIFGPILPVVPYGTLDEVIQYVNARPIRFLPLLRHNRQRVRQVLEQTLAGGVTINACMFQVGQRGLPFGGVGPSAMGRYHGFDGFATFSTKKGVFLQSRWTGLSLLRPPYGDTARRMIRFIIGN